MWDRTDTDQDNRGLYNYANDTFPSNAGTLEDYYVNIRLHYTTTGTPGEPTNPNPSHNAMGIPATGYVTWDFGINTDTYDLLFGPAESMIEVVSGADAGTSGMYTYTDLNSGSEYNWQVIAHNSSKSTTNGPIWSFCVTAILPIAENFDSITPPELPNCWSKINDTDDPFAYVETRTGSYHTEPNYVRMYNYYYTNGNLLLISPHCNNTVANTNITFWAKSDYSSYDIHVIVGSMSDPTDASTFTSSETVLLSPNYTEYTVNIGTISDKYFAIKHGMDASYTVIYIDDIICESYLSEIDDVVISYNNGTEEVELNWSYPVIADSFFIYRDTDPYFTPNPGNKIASTTSTSYSEPASENKYFYKVTAVK